MRFLSVIFFLAITIQPLSAAESLFWDREVSPERLGSVDIPAPGAPLRATPTDRMNYSAAEEMLIKEFGIIGINLDMPETEVALQMKNPFNMFGFEHALRNAINSFFEDYRDPLCPLSVILRNMGVSAGSPSKSNLKLAKLKLAQLMNMPGSSLILVREEGSNQAGRGESVKDNWVFYMRLTYSSHNYWGVVNRSGQPPVYNYGAN